MYRWQNRCVQFAIYTDLFTLNENILFCIESHNGDKKVKKNAIPCQFVTNKLVVESLPSQFQIICSVKKNLIQESNYNAERLHS